MPRTPKPTSTKKGRTTDALEIIDRMIGDDQELRELAELAEFEVAIGGMIYDARTQAGFTQTQLAERVGTDQSVISRMEDADYEGHSLSMLRRIASALGKRVEVRFLDAE